MNDHLALLNRISSLGLTPTRWSGQYWMSDMILDDTQRNKVAAWINEGLKLAEIQKRLEIEFGLRLTYLDVRFLVDDLKLKPKDPPPQPKPVAPPEAASPLSAPPGRVSPFHVCSSMGGGGGPVRWSAAR